MAKPFDPGPLASSSEFLNSIDDVMPDWLRFEIDRTVVDEVGLSVREVVASNAPKSLLTIYTTDIDTADTEVGRLLLSPKRWDISSEMAHNVYIRYTTNGIIQFFFHTGWDKESARAFVYQWQMTCLKVRARNPRYKMKVRELVTRLRDAHLLAFWRGGTPD